MTRAISSAQHSAMGWIVVSGEGSVYRSRSEWLTKCMTLTRSISMTLRTAPGAPIRGIWAQADPARGTAIPDFQSVMKTIRVENADVS